MSQSKVFLAPASKQGGRGRAYQHLQNTIVDQVKRETYRKYTSNEFGEEVAIWGAVPGSKGTWDQISAGDFLLFYIGGETYRYAAKVIDKARNEELADELWADYDSTVTGGDDPHDPWEYVIYLEDPIKVDIDGSEIHGIAGHKINYTQRFVRINDQGTQTLHSRFGSVENYLAKRSVGDTQP